MSRTESHVHLCFFVLCDRAGFCFQTLRRVFGQFSTASCCVCSISPRFAFFLVLSVRLFCVMSCCTLALVHFGANTSWWGVLREFGHALLMRATSRWVFFVHWTVESSSLLSRWGFLHHIVHCSHRAQYYPTLWQEVLPCNVDCSLGWGLHIHKHIQWSAISLWGFLVHTALMSWCFGATYLRATRTVMVLRWLLRASELVYKMQSTVELNWWWLLRAAHPNSSSTLRSRLHLLVFVLGAFYVKPIVTLIIFTTFWVPIYPKVMIMVILILIYDHDSWWWWGWVGSCLALVSRPHLKEGCSWFTNWVWQMKTLATRFFNFCIDLFLYFTNRLYRICTTNAIYIWYFELFVYSQIGLDSNGRDFSDNHNGPRNKIVAETIDAGNGWEARWLERHYCQFVSPLNFSMILTFAPLPFPQAPSILNLSLVRPLQLIFSLTSHTFWTL